MRDFFSFFFFLVAGLNCKYVFSGGPHGRLAFVTKCVNPLKIKSIIIIIIIIIIIVIGCNTNRSVDMQ